MKIIEVNSVNARQKGRVVSSVLTDSNLIITGKKAET